jgi:hypothetical protein
VRHEIETAVLDLDLDEVPGLEAQLLKRLLREGDLALGADASGLHERIPPS